MLAVAAASAKIIRVHRTLPVGAGDAVSVHDARSVAEPAGLAVAICGTVRSLVSLGRSTTVAVAIATTFALPKTIPSLASTTSISAQVGIVQHWVHCVEA